MCDVAFWKWAKGSMKASSLRGLLGPLWIFLLGANLACSARSLDQLDPSIFGYANDTSSSRIVSTGADLAATLTDVTVSTIILNGVPVILILMIQSHIVVQRLLFST